MTNYITQIEKRSQIEDMEPTGASLLKNQLQLFFYNRKIIWKKEEAVHDIATGQVGALARCHEHTFIIFILSKQGGTVIRYAHDKPSSK